MQELTKLHKDILTECAEDYIGLWSVLFDARTNFKNIDSRERRRRVIGILRDLLEAGLIEAGFPTPDGQGFVPLVLSIDETIKHIENKWNILKREPTIGEIVWFTTTKEGDRQCSELIKKNNSMANNDKRNEQTDILKEVANKGIVVNYPTYPGRLVELPGGGRVGLRAKSRLGIPVIDINIPYMNDIKKINFR